MADAGSRSPAGALRGTALRELILTIDPGERDDFVDELLGIEPPPPDGTELPRGGVPYLPASVNSIIEMVEAVPLREDDVLVDVGSGLGRALILAHLLSGARARGVEIQAHLIERARARCAALGLTMIEHVHGNAADVELAGSVFLLYAPCNGALLTAVLRGIESVARAHKIVVCTIDLELHDVPWLVLRARSSTSLTIYDSRV
ncbi:MAG: cyclopropane-fatty-acyl-phospholipid synthase family protein [Kofleriaceae bacterium]